MASLRVLAFDHEGCPIQFDTWLNDLQLYLLSDSRDSVSLFDHTPGAALAPPATADSATRSQWLTHDAAACLIIRNHLPLAECTLFGQHRTAQALYDAEVACYSSPATAALGRLLLPYLFPELSAFATVEDLVTHLRTSDAGNRAALPAEFLERNPPPMYITLYIIVTCLPDSLRAVRDHFLTLDPTTLIVDLLEQHLLAGETSLLARPFFRGVPPPPLPPATPLLQLLTSLVLRMSGLLLLVGSATAARARVAGVVAVAAGVVVGAAVEVVEVVAVVGVVGGVAALVAAVVAAVGVAVVAAVGVVAVGLELLSREVLAVARGSSSSSIGARPRHPRSFVSGFLSMGRTSSDIQHGFLLRPLAGLLSWGGHPPVDVTFDESVPFYRLFPYCSAPFPPLPPPLFLAPGPPPVDPLLPQGPAPSGVSQVDPFSGGAASRGAASGGVASGGAEPPGSLRGSR
ncbi:unnamed protein product [Closterium sp. NIES-54]